MIFGTAGVREMEGGKIGIPDDSFLTIVVITGGFKSLFIKMFPGIFSIIDRPLLYELSTIHITLIYNVRLNTSYIISTYDGLL